MKRNFPIPFTILCISILIFSCVKDTDFEQANDIVLTPVYELDLIYFTVQAREFYDSITQSPRLTVIDTTQIRFLDDSFVQDDLKKAEFTFNFTNSVSSNFQVDFQFLNASNDTTYSAQADVFAGSVENPRLTSVVETVNEDDVQFLTQADRVVVAVSLAEPIDSLVGALNLQSKTTYFLEIKD
ncbi:MAG: hypothetical protein R3359_12575 [Marinirhabdus sp.]|nr:hypothetical protein [Marinirhabdus sp.]